MNAFLRMFVSRDWRMVKSINSPYRIYNKDTNKNIKENCALTYYLYENQFGERKFDVVDSEEGDLDLNRLEALENGRKHYLWRSETFRNTVRPWLDGRLDPDIPTYDKVPKDDFQNALAGKKVK